MTSTTDNPIVTDLENYLASYVAFQDDGYRFTAALWTLGTYLWRGFNTFPYLVITSDTKRSGKTTLSELISFAAKTPRNVAGVTIASVLRMMRDEGASLFIDEAEALKSESSPLRPLLNIGYRRGQTFPRAAAGPEGNIYWPVYGPKCFVLIGDVYDTLRDRSVIVYMKRAAAPQRYRRDIAEGEGNELHIRIEALMNDGAESRIHDVYAGHEGLPFLSGRDEEIWLALVAICQVLAPSRVAELQRVAMDIATEKTAPTRTTKGLQDAENAATASEYAVRLLQDMGQVLPEDGRAFTDDIVTALKAIPLAPWRKFRGAGLDANDVGNMLKPFGVRPKNIRSAGGRKASVVRKGYVGADVWAALRSNSLA